MAPCEHDPTLTFLSLRTGRRCLEATGGTECIRVTTTTTTTISTVAASDMIAFRYDNSASTTSITGCNSNSIIVTIISLRCSRMPVRYVGVRV